MIGRIAAVISLILAIPFCALEAQIVFARGGEGELLTTSIEDGRWQSLGGYIAGSPDACSWGPERIDVFARSGSGALAQIARVGNSWSGWFEHAGEIASGPTAVSMSENRIDVFAVGMDSSMLQKTWTGTQWTGWVSIGGQFDSEATPDAVSTGRGLMHVFARGMDNALWQNSWAGNQWSGWSSVGGQITSGPGAVSWGGGRIDVFARGNAGQVMQASSSGGGWSWVDHGGSLLPGDGPDAASFGVNHLAVVALDSRGSVVQKTWDGRQWTDWISAADGGVSSEPAAVALRVPGARFRALVGGILRSYGAHTMGAVSVGAVDRLGKVYYWNLGFIEPGVRATEASVYSIGSNSKVLTATMVRQLAEEGRLKLDAPAQQYLDPRIVLPVFEETPMTVRHLLRHESGLPPNFRDPEVLDMRIDNFIRYMATVTLTRRPGTPEYSNVGSEVFTAIVEHLDQRTYHASLLARIAVPLGMASTAPNLMIRPRLPARKVGYPEGGGYVQSNIEDMVKFMKAATRPTVESVSGPILRSQPEGLGWFGNEMPGGYHHTGGNPAADPAFGWHSSAMLADPTVSQLGAIVLSQGASLSGRGPIGVVLEIVTLARSAPGGDVYNW